MALFNETVQWKLLSFFFRKPEGEAYVKELSRAAKVSAGSVSIICKRLANEKILNKNKKGNAIFYSLANADPLVKKIKSAWFLEMILAFREVWEREEFQSVALYGSYAAGDFIAKSDIDVLVITNMEEKKVFEVFREIRHKFNAEISLTVIPLSRWRKMMKERDRFCLEVLSNHILIYGDSLVVG
jgi:predicted nucleotidyltransferase